MQNLTRLVTDIVGLSAISCTMLLVGKNIFNTSPKAVIITTIAMAVFADPLNGLYMEIHNKRMGSELSSPPSLKEKILLTAVKYADTVPVIVGALCKWITPQEIAPLLALHSLAGRVWVQI